jgi:hypothetical protein
MSSIDEKRQLIPKAPAPEAFIGAVSPLWGFFTLAAASGVAWWWMTQWTRPQNLEAMFGRAADLSEQAAAAVRAQAPVLQALAVDAATETVKAATDGAPELSVVHEPKRDRAQSDRAAKSNGPSAEPRSIAPRSKEPPSEPKSV